MSARKCSSCGKVVPDVQDTNGYPFVVKVWGKKYLACGPTCAFKLGGDLTSAPRVK